MTELKRRIAATIEAAGPISVSDYFALCLLDPTDGYYTTREPFGAAGDFITAPEISQMFGELVGIWLALAWKRAGRPLPATLAEIGPGRGTMMKDALRALRRAAPDFASGAEIALIERSPRLIEVQRRTLGAEATRTRWCGSIEELSDAPLFIVGNELFDAIPIRQFVKTAEGWRERVVGLDEAGEFAFFAGAGGVDPALLPHGAVDAEIGAIAELSPARAALMQTVAERIREFSGAALFIDYGHAEPGLGDTLQAVRRHAYDDVLAHPGEADLTAHVDFAALAAVARTAGLKTRFRTQGEFLLGLGLLERAGRLGVGGDDALQRRLTGEVERLAGPDAMGSLFKVLEIARP